MLLIQSNNIGFGSGMVRPGTDIALHDRGRYFSLDSNHLNCFAPDQRPYHIIIAGFMTQGDGGWTLSV